MQSLTVLDMIKWWMLFIDHQQDALPCLILFILSFHKYLLGPYHIPGNVQGTEDTLWHRQKRSLIRWWQGLKRIQVGGVTARASGPRLPGRSARTLEVRLKEAPSCKQHGGSSEAGSVRGRGRGWCRGDPGVRSLVCLRIWIGVGWSEVGEVSRSQCMQDIGSQTRDPVPP